MKPFDPPANANTRPNALAAALPLWLHLPMASSAAAIDVATYQMQCWTAFHQVAFDAYRRFWTTAAPINERAADESPVVAQTATDMRSAGAAVLQAQLDTMQAFRRSA